MLRFSSGPVIVGQPSERMALLEATSTRRARNAGAQPGLAEFSGKVLLPATDGRPATLAAVSDGNRSVIVPRARGDVAGRGFALGAKGVGARSLLYGESQGPTSGVERHMTGEAWFGESPFGAQGERAASFSLMVTEMAEGGSINGFHICPTLEVNEIPASELAQARSEYWYRRHTGPFLQELRLMPSNVRLYHESTLTLGQDPGGVLEAFQVSTVEALDGFIDRYIASGVAALTLFARTAKPTRWGARGLDYHGVYLDKDAVVATDGTLHFADTEGLDWLLGGADISVEQRVREQFDYNFYEVFYGLDRLLEQRETLAKRPLSREERRRGLPARIAMALGRDRFVAAEEHAKGLDLIVHAPGVDVAIRAVDLG